MSMNSDLEELLMMSLLKLQGSGALPDAVNERIQAARPQGPGGKILALRALSLMYIYQWIDIHQ